MASMRASSQLKKCPASQRCVGSGEYEEVELRRQTPIYLCVSKCTLQKRPSVYSTQHLSSAEDKNFPFCPHLRTRKKYGKQMLFSKPSTMAYLTMVVLPSWQLLTQY